MAKCVCARYGSGDVQRRGLRSLRTGSHCGAEHHWQVDTTMVSPLRMECPKPGAANQPPTLSLWRVAALILAVEAVGICAVLRSSGPSPCPGSATGPARSAEAAWVRRWSAILACTAARCLHCVCAGEPSCWHRGAPRGHGEAWFLSVD